MIFYGNCFIFIIELIVNSLAKFNLRLKNTNLLFINALFQLYVVLGKQFNIKLSRNTS